MTDEIQNGTYNGWSNYETWLVNLWLINNESTQAIPYLPADQIEEFISDQFEALDLPNGLMADLLKSAIAEIDFREIAKDGQDTIEAVAQFAEPIVKP